MHKTLLVLSILVLVGCATKKLFPVPPVSHSLDTYATFVVPHGWKAKTKLECDPYGWAINQKKSSKSSRCSIGMHYYILDNSQLGGQQKLADSYLEGIHRHNDENVKMQITDTFISRRYGVLHVYRYYSDYWKDRRAVFIVDGNRNVFLESFAVDIKEAERGQTTLEELAATVQIR